jgi:hypothetical protein
MNPYTIKNDDPRVKAAVKVLQAQGAPQQVEFKEEEAVFYNFTTYTTTFIAANGRRYEAISGLLALYPQVSFVEMQSLGMISKG